MKNNTLLLALLSCSFVSISHASDSEDFGHFDEAAHTEAQSAAAVTPHEQKMADRIAQEHDARQQQKGQPKKHGKEARKSTAHAEKGKNKKAKKAHTAHKKHVKGAYKE